MWWFCRFNEKKSRNCVCASTAVPGYRWWLGIRWSSDTSTRWCGVDELRETIRTSSNYCRCVNWLCSCNAAVYTACKWPTAAAAAAAAALRHGATDQTKQHPSRCRLTGQKQRSGSSLADTQTSAAYTRSLAATVECTDKLYLKVDALLSLFIRSSGAQSYGGEAP